MTDLSVDELRRLLDPKTLTEGGIQGAGSRRVTMDSLYSKTHIRESLDPQPSTPEEDMQWLAGATARGRVAGARRVSGTARAGGRARASGGA